MNTKLIYIIFFLFLFSEELSENQLKAISEVTEDLNNAPNFTLKATNGENITLDGLKGKVVLINFWAIWCEPCILEMYEFNSLYDKYNDKVDVPVNHQEWH